MFAGENELKGDPRLPAINKSIRVFPNYPKPGFSFFLSFSFYLTFFFYFCFFSRRSLFQSSFLYFFLGVSFFFLKFMFAGIMFQDITTLLLDHKAFKGTVDIFVERYRDMDISVVAGNMSLSHTFRLFMLWSVAGKRYETEGRF